MTPEQEEWLIRNLQQQQEQLQEMRAENRQRREEFHLQLQQTPAQVENPTRELREGFTAQITDMWSEHRHSAEWFEAQMVEMRAKRQASEAQFQMQAGFAELREAQALMMQQFRERDGRLIEAQLGFIRERREVAKLRLDFLNPMRHYHPPIER